MPDFLLKYVPPIWDSLASLPGCTLPILVVHSTADGLFPVQMAHDVVACCGDNAELLIVHGLRHNEPFYKPDISYWGQIVSRIAP